MYHIACNTEDFLQEHFWEIQRLKDYFVIKSILTTHNNNTSNTTMPLMVCKSGI